MIRPSIPVRDGIMARYRARMPGAQRLPHPTVADYVLGWRWGVVCGLVAGATLTGLVWGFSSDKPPARPTITGHPSCNL